LHLLDVHAATPLYLTRNVGTVEREAAVAEPEQAGHAARQRGLAAARLSDKAEDLPALDRERHVVDGTHRVGRAAEAARGMLHAEQRRRR